MARERIPEEVQRFILTGIPSVPYLEAMLLLYNEPMRPWDSSSVSARLYVSDKTSAQLLADLCAAGIATPEHDGRSCRYHPNSDELQQMISRVATVYAQNIVEVTQLIHSATGKKAQQFADAFKWRKDP